MKKKELGNSMMQVKDEMATVSMTVRKYNRDNLRRIANMKRWGYDALIEDMIIKYEGEIKGGKI